MKYSERDTNKMTWDEVSNLVDILISKTSKKNINVIAPMLRTGGIVGGIFSIKTGIVPMLPVQFKYSYNPTAINQIISVPDIIQNVPETMNVLLCEGNTSSGSIAMKASKAIREKYPGAKIYLATLTKVYGCPEKLDGIEEIFFGVMTDENFKATESEKKSLKLRKGITIFPWENVEAELSDVNNVL